MRITGGNKAGVSLTVPKGWDVRPTPDRVRQALFNSLGDRLLDARVLELFAGTGALSLECLSRGAREAVCIERTAKHARHIKQNIRRCGYNAATLRILAQDAFLALQRLTEAKEIFDLILADPPFGPKTLGRRSTSDAQKLLDDPNLPRLLSDDGRFVLGHARRDAISTPPSWQERRTLKHGDSIVHFFSAIVTQQKKDLD